MSHKLKAVLADPPHAAIACRSRVDVVAMLVLAEPADNENQNSH